MSESVRTINLCALGDPRSPRTWSGTPAHITRELQEANRLQQAFDVEPGRLEKALLAGLSAPLFGRYDFQRHPLRRLRAAARCARATAASGTSHTIHMGSLTLPFRRAPQGQSHYLFCDATWNLWKAGATDMGRFNPRLVVSAERLERKAYEQAAHVFPIAEYVREDLINHYGLAPDKVTAVGTGLGLVKPFHGEKDGTRKRILFTAKGRFFDKGGPLAVEAFRLAREQDPELELTLVGCEDGLQLPPTHGMTTLGFVPFEELQRLFETHHLFLLPATNEPWGLVYLEAMACGMPIVGLNRNSFPELSGGGRFGWAPPAETPEALAQTLLHAFADRPRLDQMGRHAQSRCLREYTWSGTVRTMIDVIDSQ